MTEDDWLDSCADQPDDDLRRRAFADWLEERGDYDRAEFIRLRVALSRVPEDEEDQTQVKRAAELLDRHRTEWLGPLVDLADAYDWFFHRGLPDALSLTDKGWSAESVAELVASTHLARLTELYLAFDKIGDAGVQAIATSPHLARLTLLDLSFTRIGNPGAQALAASPHLARLSTLILTYNEIGDAGAQALAASPHLTRLTKLWLTGNDDLGATGAEALRKAFGERVRC
jgi:uncharacterized protein (TIGR02996 family)